MNQNAKICAIGGQRIDQKKERMVEGEKERIEKGSRERIEIEGKDSKGN